MKTDFLPFRESKRTAQKEAQQNSSSRFCNIFGEKDLDLNLVTFRVYSEPAVNYLILNNKLLQTSQLEKHFHQSRSIPTFLFILYFLQAVNEFIQWAVIAWEKNLLWVNKLVNGLQKFFATHRVRETHFHHWKALLCGELRLNENMCNVTNELSFLPPFLKSLALCFCSKVSTVMGRCCKSNLT